MADNTSNHYTFTTRLFGYGAKDSRREDFSLNKVFPQTTDFDRGFIDFPRIVGGAEMWASALIKFRAMVVPPLTDGAASDFQALMTPLERVGRIHDLI